MTDKTEERVGLVLTLGLSAVALVGGTLTIRGRLVYSKQEKSVVYTADHPSLTDFSAPHFDFIEGVYCARYVRLAAKQLFNLEYETGAAWELASINRSLWLADNDEDLHDLLKKMDLTITDLYSKKVEELNKEKLTTINNLITSELETILAPGNIILSFFSGSKYNAPNVPYTHCLLYVGKSQEGEHATFHYFGKNSHSTTLDNLINFSPAKTKGHYIIPREVIAPKQ